MTNEERIDVESRHFVDALDELQAESPSEKRVANRVEAQYGGPIRERLLDEARGYGYQGCSASAVRRCAMKVLAIDPGASAGFAVVDRVEGRARVLWCAQSKPAPAKRLGEWGELMAVAKDMGAERVAIEAPCYAANQGRRTGVSAALGERVGELRALAWARFGTVEMIDTATWQRLPGWAEPMKAGPNLSERRSLRYAVDVLGVPAAWLRSERGAALYDAAAACCVGAAAVGGGR